MIHAMIAGTKMMKYLRKSIQVQRIFESWVDMREKIWNDQVGMIDRDTQEKAMILSSILRCHWVSTLVSGCATGNKMRTRQQR